MARCHMAALQLLLLAAGPLLLAYGQGCSPLQYGKLPLGDLSTTDAGGPYNIPAIQAKEVESTIAAKMAAPGGPFTDADILNFLVNTECLESIFDTYGAFGEDIPKNLSLQGNNKFALGGEKAKLSQTIEPWAQEVALDEQGHVRMIREVIGKRAVACPVVDIKKAFTEFFDMATKTKSHPPFNVYENDINFLLGTWTLEEIGATGDKGLILAVSNPGVANCIAGLAGGASYQSAVDRALLWERRNEIVKPYGLKVYEMVQKISDLRDYLGGQQNNDQGLYNFDTNYIAVPDGGMNLVQSDIRGLTFSRTPGQVLHILTMGGEDPKTGRAKGGFFPNGINGKINSWRGFKDAINGHQGYPGNHVTLKKNTAGLNKNITVVRPAPLAVQLQASGREYPSYKP